MWFGSVAESVFCAIGLRWPVWAVQFEQDLNMLNNHSVTLCPLCVGMASTPPPPCASTALSKHGVGVEPLF